MDLVGLADLHLLAVLEIVVSLLGGGEAGVLVMLAPASEVVGAAGEELAAGGGLTSVVLGRRGAVGVVVVGDVVLADGKVLRAEVPVNVHGAHSSLSEGGGHRSCGGRMSSLVVAEGDVTASLLDGLGDTGDDALVVVETGALRGLSALAGVGIGDGGVVLVPLSLQGGIRHADRCGASNERADGDGADEGAGGGALLLGLEAKLGCNLNDGSHFERWVMDGREFVLAEVTTCVARGRKTNGSYLTHFT